MNKIKNFGENKVTFVLIAINVIVFALMTLTGGSENTENLVRYGAVVKGLIAQGQWWRLLTASFIHIGLMHILFNMYFLYQLGPTFERLYGSVNFLLIYLIAGIMGNLASFAFGSEFSISAGASTSLYGMFGLALGLMLNYKNDAILHSFGASFLSIIAINIVYSFLNPRVGMLGHLGGLVGGLLLSGIFPVVNRELNSQVRIISIAAIIVLIYLLITIGLRSIN